MLNIREVLTRGLKTRFFVKTPGSSAVHISRLYGSAVRSVIFGKGFIEYTLDNPQGVAELYEVVYSPPLLKTVVYEPRGLKPIKEYSEIPTGFSSGYSFIDRVVAEIGVYRRLWAQVLCGTPHQPLDYYIVDATARGAIGYTLHARTKELLQESSKEYMGFVLGAVVSGLVRERFKVSSTTGDHCLLVERAEPISWNGTKIILSNGNATVVINVEKRLGFANPDILVEYAYKRVIIECKTGPPKTWLSKAIKQGRIYRGLGLALLVASKHLEKKESELLEEIYDDVIVCSPSSIEECITQLTSLLCDVSIR